MGSSRVNPSKFKYSRSYGQNDTILIRKIQSKGKDKVWQTRSKLSFSGGIGTLQQGLYAATGRFGNRKKRSRLHFAKGWEKEKSVKLERGEIAKELELKAAVLVE